MQLIKALHAEVNVARCNGTGGIESYWSLDAEDLDERFVATWSKMANHYMGFTCSSVKAAKITLEMLAWKELPLYKDG